MTKYKADQVKKKMPRIIVYDVTECEDPDSFRTEFLRSNDNVKDMVDYFELLKAVTVLRKDRNFANVVLEVSPQLQQSILLNSHVKLDFLMKHCEDYLFLIKCSKFCHYGHIATECRGMHCCSFRLGNYSFDDFPKSFSDRPSCSCHHSKTNGSPHASYEN